jgi:hypothetical protein
VRLSHLGLFAAAVVSLSRRCVCVGRGIEARAISAFLVAPRVVVVRVRRVRVGGLGPIGLARVAVVVYVGLHVWQRHDSGRCDGAVHAVVALHGVVYDVVYGVHTVVHAIIHAVIHAAIHAVVHAVVHGMVHGVVYGVVNGMVQGAVHGAIHVLLRFRDFVDYVDWMVFLLGEHCLGRLIGHFRDSFAD